MARSMIQRRQEAERQRREIYDATLREVTRPARVAPDFTQALEDAARGFAGDAVREARAWRPRMKTHDAARLRLAAARHLFALYAVPAALEDIWLDDGGLADAEVRLRRRWYIVAAKGGSLYQAGASAWLTRKEVHAFLNTPAGLGFDAALWRAVALSYTDDGALALRIARSKIARASREDMAFWRSAVRFFCTHPAAPHTMDDLCDHLAACRQRDARYSLVGRTPASLARRMHEWHRDFAAIERIQILQQRARRRGAAALADAGWPGSPLSDWDWTPVSKDAKARGERFVVRQLRRAEELVLESRAMRHCVASYAAKCIAGQASIWSLRRCGKDHVDRLLTIEVDRHDSAVQVRGFANRPPHPHERQVLERWARARGIGL